MSDRVTMTALDTFHASNVRADNLQEGDVFHCSGTDAKQLEARGLAERGGKASDAVNVNSTSDRPDTREEIDRERGFELGKAIGSAPANKQVDDAPNNKAVTTATKRARKH